MSLLPRHLVLPLAALTAALLAVPPASASPDGRDHGDVIPGDGVYKTTDGGRTWRHMGLADTQMIGKIRIDPANCDRVFVAALGHAFGPNDERGVFRSTNGGANWDRVLFRDNLTGAVD